LLDDTETRVLVEQTAVDDALALVLGL
jgi:hypothetical protein